MSHRTRAGLTGILLAACMPSILIRGEVAERNFAFLNNARRQASANPTLTNFASGLAQDLKSAIAEFIAPTCVVPSTIGQFKRFDDKNAFQVYTTARAVGGKATRIEFNSEDPTYNCRPHALEVTVDDSERDAADSEDPIALDESKIQTLITSTTLSHEVQVIAKTVGAMTPVVSVGVWSNDANDPIEEIDAQITAIATETGMLPNRIAIGLPAWNIIRNHPKVIARQPGAAIVGLTVAQFAAMLVNPGIEVKIGILSRDTTKPGKAKVAANVVGGNVLIFIGSQAPTQYDPSFAKNFTGKRGGVTAVRTYREDSARSDVHAVDWSEDIQIVGNACGKLITLS